MTALDSTVSDAVSAYGDRIAAATASPLNASIADLNTTLSAQAAIIKSDEDQIAALKAQLAVQSPGPTPAKMIVGAALGVPDTLKDNPWLKGARLYDNGKGVSALASQLAAIPQTLAVSMSFKYLPKDILSGSKDAEIKSWAVASLSKRQAMTDLSLWHEPEDDVEKNHTFSAADYRAAYDHLGSLLRPLGLPHFRLGTMLMGWTLDKASGRNPEDYYVPSADFLGFDVYSIVQGTLCPAYAKSKGKPTIYGEFGKQGDALDVVRGELNHGAYPGPEAVYYFNSNTGGQFTFSANPNVTAFLKSLV